MDQDFEIEIISDSSLIILKDFLTKCPIELELIQSKAHGTILSQNKVSQIAGFEFDSYENDVYLFQLYMSYRSPISVESVISQFSDFLKLALLPHKITEILHEVDFDEEWVNYHWPETHNKTN